MRDKKPTVLALLTGVSLWSGMASAAMISGYAENDVIGIGETTTVNITLELAPGEVASVFEGRFDLVGLGSVADANFTPGGTSWSSGFGNIVGTEAIASLTSDNIGDNRLIGSFDVTGVSVGAFDILLGSPTIASFDTATAPYLESLDITTDSGSSLASVQVVPLPATLPLFGSALVGLAFGTTRRRPRNILLRNRKAKT